MSFLSAERARQTDPNRPAVLLGDQVVTYADLDARVGRAAGLLVEHGVGRGDRVALQLPKSLAFLELHLAALGLGAATLPLNPTYTDREVAFYLNDAKPKLAVVAAAGAAPTGQALPAAHIRAALDAAAPAPLPAWLDPETVALICYTSGTTGRPKGAVITHRNLGATVRALHTAWRWGRGDHLLHVLPLFHIHGLFVAMHGALYAGATTTWMDRFDPLAALQLLDERGCTMFMGVPTHYNRFLRLPAPTSSLDLSRVRLFTSGSAPLPARAHRDFHDRFGHVVLERYGMTEVGIVLSNPVAGTRKPGAVGRSVPGARLEIRHPDTGQPVPQGAVGELCHAGPSVIARYLDRPDATAAAIQQGWLRSGDLGYQDADGDVHLVGRAKDLVISGGLNVYPSEVEGALLEHPGVAEVAVVGRPDPDLGERVVAFVVAAPGATVAPAALVAFARARLAPYKCPKDAWVVAELPRNAMGKVQKSVLRLQSAAHDPAAGLVR